MNLDELDKFVRYLDFIVTFFFDFVNGILDESKNIAPYVALVRKRKPEREPNGCR